MKWSNQIGLVSAVPWEFYFEIKKKKKNTQKNTEFVEFIPSPKPLGWERVLDNIDRNMILNVYFLYVNMRIKVILLSEYIIQSINIQFRHTVTKVKYSMTVHLL